MADGAEQQESFEAKGLGIEAKVKARRILGDNAIVVMVLCALLFGLYKHHTVNEEALTRVFEAMQENTYVLSLSQAEREKLDLRMPESLRRKRGRE